MMVAATDGKMSIANFETYFCSMPTTPRTRFDGGTLRHIKGSTATDRWQFGKWRGSRFQLDLQEHDFGGGLVEHIVFHPGLPEVGLAKSELRLGTLAIGRHDGHFARGHRNDDVIHLMDMMTGRAARRQPPLGDADFRRIDLNV